MTGKGAQPAVDEFELTLIGPGYGESIVIHIGHGDWIVIDSCLGADKTPRATRYLQSIGVDPAQAVKMIVATHWHDDHIQGMAQLVGSCPQAIFCCASVLCHQEFLALVKALEGLHLSASGSGLREIHRVISQLKNAGKTPTHALANRVIFRRETCELTSLSPDDGLFQNFLKSVGSLIPKKGEDKKRISSVSPNEVAVALWIDAGHFALLLGSDLEKGGWSVIVNDPARPADRASVFKVPHHGSQNADEPAVWRQMLEPEPFAVLTPWRRGGRALPKKPDTERILANTPNAYITRKSLPQARPNPRHKNKTVEKTLRESGAKFRSLAARDAMVQLRRPLAPQTQWSVKTFGDARPLAQYTV